MPYSYNIVTTTGMTANVAVPFPFLLRGHVSITLDGVLVPPSDYTWVSNGLITLNSTPAAGKTQTVKRLTPADEPAVVFSTGNLSSRNLNTALLQQLYIAQEAFDRADLIVAEVLPEYIEQAQAAADAAEAALVEIQRLVDAITADGPVAIVAADLGGNGWAYDLGKVTDPDASEDGTPPGFIQRVAEALDEITALASQAANMTALAPQATNIGLLGPQAAAIGTLSGAVSEIGALNGVVLQIAALGPVADEIADLAPQASNIADLADPDVLADLAALGPVSADIDVLGPQAANIGTLAPIAADISAVAAGGGVPPNGSVTSAKVASAGLDFGVD